MKPGMQRDILVAYWLLFDEFEIGNDCSLPPPETQFDSTAVRSTPQDPQRSQNPKSGRTG